MGKDRRKFVIYGCEGRGEKDSAYLTRYRILSTRFGGIYLHIFHRSDSDDMHDHPWPFVSIPLWRGYIEHTPNGARRVWPGMVLRRPAEWQHRVQLVKGKPAVTLIFKGNRVRDWGFYPGGVWEQWQEYNRKWGC